MKSLLRKHQLTEMGRLLVAVAVRILTVPHLMVLGMALILAVPVGLFGAPVEIVLNFVLEATGAVVVLQAKLLLIVVFIGALCFAVGAYRLDVLASYVAAKLQPKIRALQLLWVSMLAGGRPLFLLPTAGALRIPTREFTAGPRAGFVAGHTPQLE